VKLSFDKRTSTNNRKAAGIRMLTIRSFTLEDTDQVIDLWRRCGLVRPNKDPHKDITRKSKFRGDLFLVVFLGGLRVGSVMVG